MIELVTVLLIITVLSTIAIRSTVDIGYSARFEQTRERLSSLRQAIVGNPKRSINGQPDISGFVADMGRLPRNIRELLDQDYCFPDKSIDETDYDDITYASAKLHCDTAHGPNSWKETRNYSACSDDQYFDEASCIANSGNWYPFESGWNGPYLSISDNLLEDDIFTDGWGRENQGNSDHDYGWSVCRWDDSHDTANSALPNEMPDDTDVTPDGLPNCISAYATLNQHLNLYSLGKDGTGDVAADGSVTCGNDEYDDDCYSRIKEEDYKIDVTNGINVSMKTEYHPGACHYLKSQGPSTSIVNECLNVGGVAGICKKTTHTTQSACETNNLNWDAELGWCLDFNQQTSTGTATADCGFTSSTTDATEKWGICVDETITNQTDCSTTYTTNAVWWVTQNWCIDKSLNADACGALTLKTEFCQYSNDLTCHAGGGDWENCFFEPDTCPETWTESCKLTVNSCENSAGGTWSYANGNCTLDNQPLCESAGGAWTTSCSINSDGVTSEENCQSIGGSWQGVCPQNSTSCSGTGKTWHSNSEYCEFTNKVCSTTNEGDYRIGGVCRRSHSDITSSTLTQSVCEGYGGQEWTTEKRQICMNLFYRNSVDSSFARLESNAATITLDGSYQNIKFSFPDNVTQAECEDGDGFNDGEWDTGLTQCFFNVANGVNAIGVYEYDSVNSCDPSTNAFFPMDRETSVPVLFLPKTSVPTINW